MDKNKYYETGGILMGCYLSVFMDDSVMKATSAFIVGT